VDHSPPPVVTEVRPGIMAVRGEGRPSKRLRHHQFRPEATVDVDISVAGHFSSGTPIDEDAARSFSTVNGLLLLWPYLRGYVGSLAASMQLDLPTLPVIDAAELIRRVENQTRTREVAANADHDGNATRT
jgi:preprotein translocase subunit SecB